MSYTRIPCNAWVDRNDSAAAREPRIGKSLAPTLTVLASLLCCAGVSAQPQRAPAVVDPYLQTVWTTENGLPQNSVTAIVQSRDGYLWLSTFGGLARLDGVRFTIFNSANTPGLKSNRITALLEDRRGILWLGTETGELMSLQDGVGTTYPLGVLWKAPLSRRSLGMTPEYCGWEQRKDWRASRMERSPPTQPPMACRAI